MDTKSEVVKLLSKAAGLKESEVYEILEVPPNPELGDYALPCFKLAAKLKKAPQIIAKDISVKFKINETVCEVKAAGPYVNLFLNAGLLAENLVFNILAKGQKFGAGQKKPERVMVEFSQPNTHKSFHIGHFRGTSIGDSLVKILRTNGYETLAVNYPGDIGTHVAKVIWFLTKFHKGKFPKENRGEWLGKMYAAANKELEGHESYHTEVAETLVRLESGDTKLEKLWKETRKWSLDEFNRIYKQLGVEFDQWIFESEVEAGGKKIALNLVKKGLAIKDRGALLVDLTKYNLDKFLVLKSDGASLYATKDLELARLKFEKFKVDSSIVITGYEQKFYFQQLFKTLELMGFKQASRCKHLPYGLVNVGGKKMSSRAGDVVTYTELFDAAYKEVVDKVKQRNEKLPKRALEETAMRIAIAALKYGMLKQSAEKTIDFDWERALEFEGDTGPYLQYALVRAKKILQKAGKKPNKANFNLLQMPQEAELVKKLSSFPDVVEKAGREYAPNLVANYAFELANTFSTFYEACPVIAAESEGLRNMRLKLVQAFAQVLKNALYLLGIDEVWVM